MTERRGYRITGAVQGVGFRWWTRQTAGRLELRGTVRNARDGSVDIDVAGDRETLDHFEELLREGPRAARVTGLQNTEPGEDALPTGFEIIR